MKNTKYLTLDAAGVFGLAGLSFFLIDLIFFKEDDFFAMIGGVLTLIGIFWGLRRSEVDRKKLVILLSGIIFFSLIVLLYFFYRFKFF